MTTKVIMYGVGQMNMLATRLLKERGIDIVGASIDLALKLVKIWVWCRALII